MKKIQCIYFICFMFFVFSCKHEQEESLPQCPNDNLLNNFTVTLSIYFDQWICPQCQNKLPLSLYFWDAITKLNSGEEKVAYYESMKGAYQKSYSSMSDSYEEEIYTSEYVLSMDSVLDSMETSLINHLLSVAVDKHKRKFGKEYVTPFNARYSGILLILSILQHEHEYAVLDKICGYCHKYDLSDPFELAVNEKFNSFLIQEVSDYLSTKK